MERRVTGGGIRHEREKKQKETDTHIQSLTHKQTRLYIYPIHVQAMQNVRNILHSYCQGDRARDTHTHTQTHIHRERKRTASHEIECHVKGMSPARRILCSVYNVIQFLVQRFYLICKEWNL